jgi:hypothetical protein
MPVPYGQKPDTSLIKMIIAILVIICISIISPHVIEPMMNNVTKDITLQELETAFNGIDHPDNTERISLEKVAGTLSDNGKGCDFFVGEVRSHQGSRDNIRAHYDGKSIEDYGAVRVIFIEDNAIPEVNKLDLPNNLNTLSQWNLEPAKIQQSLYIVYVFSIEHPTGFDTQCR